MEKTIKEMIEVMEWFDKGGEVEYRKIGYCDWATSSASLWNWASFEYRKKNTNILYGANLLILI